jgi:hypothetical protein
LRHCRHQSGGSATDGDVIMVREVYDILDESGLSILSPLKPRYWLLVVLASLEPPPIKVPAFGDSKCWLANCQIAPKSFQILSSAALPASQCLAHLAPSPFGTALLHGQECNNHTLTSGCSFAPGSTLNQSTTHPIHLHGATYPPGIFLPCPLSPVLDLNSANGPFSVVLDTG